MDKMKKLFILYAVIIFICFASIGVGVYAEFFQADQNDSMDVLGNLMGKQENKEEVKINLINQFDQIFHNAIQVIQNAKEVGKVDREEPLVYTLQEFAKQEPLLYNVDFHIPTINIKSKVAEEINQEIADIFTQKAIDILTKKEIYTIYNVSYVSYIYDDILSLAIKATLKEGNHVQRVILQTYNYNLATEELMTLGELLATRGVTQSAAQTVIDKQIKKFNEEDMSLTALGYEGYTRDINDSQYKIENTTTYFLGEEGYLYIIYAYGNKAYTSQTDIILF